jgi:hypothetical protein
VGLGAGLCKVLLPPHTSGTNDPDCLGLILQPVAPPPLPMYSACVYSRGSGGGLQPSLHVAGGPGYTGSSLWIFLAMAGVFAVSRSQHPVHRCACLLSLLPLWGWS